VNQQLQILTTEHMNLQFARGTVVAESNGRVGLYLGALSSAVVAIAFVAQGSRFGLPFFVFTLVLLVPLIFIGFATYVRVLQASVEDAMCERGMNRIRHYFVEVAPATERYFVLATNDDLRGTIHNLAIKTLTRQHFFTMASMVGVINGALLGVFAALAVMAGFGAPLVGAACGLLVAAVVIAIELLHEQSRWKALEKVAPPLFPTQAASC
jgi:hypothetical protein